MTQRTVTTHCTIAAINTTALAADVAATITIFAANTHCAIAAVVGELGGLGK